MTDILTELASPSLSQKLRSLPETPGVYKMLGAKNEILYVGKAKNLRSRVRSYFHKSGLRDITRLLVAKIRDLDVIITRSEKEALILENNLIKEHKPLYNINLKDNKTYPYIKITTEEKWPRVIKTRELGKGGLYFGPYTDLSLMYHYLDIANEIFALKKCGQRQFPKGFKPCLYFHMGRCLDYCTGGVAREKADELVREVASFLNGKTENAIEFLENKMRRESALLNYERAALIRDKIAALAHIRDRQQVVLVDHEAFDVFHYHLSDGGIILAALSFREGKLLGKETFQFENVLLASENPDASESEAITELFEQFLFQYYSERPYPVREIFTPFSPLVFQDLAESLAALIPKRFSGPVPDPYTPVFLRPERGDKLRVLELAESNARLSFFELVRAKEKEGYAHQLKDILGLAHAPQTIECFDIANTADQAIIAGMVRFNQGQKDKANYRIFNIRSTTRQDDFLSMREAVHRRYQRLLDEKTPLPDLILIDGGKGQLSAALESLAALGLKHQPICSLAKEEELIFLPETKDPIRLPHDHPALQFLVEVRDENHRFVTGRHTQRRDREGLQSRLEKIPGIGPKKIKVLYEHFSDLDAFLAASDAELENIPLMSKTDIQQIRKSLVKPETKSYKLKRPGSND
ncbi:MAG: excinuclease ABC subunit UvrC [Spirochaetia bacterium]|nr:excinuclease ABC subunit UvrC [Spirochaetia bacterium]